MKRLFIIIIVLFQIFACSSHSKPSLSIYKKGTIIESQIHSNLNIHTASVEKVTFSPDGHIIASTGADKTIRIWDKSTGNNILTIPSAHNDSISSIAFSPDGKTIVSGSNDYTVKTWQVETGKLIKILGSHSLRVTDVAYSFDGKIIASASADNTIKLWDVKTGLLINTLKGHKKTVTSIAFSPDKQHLVSASADKTIMIWNISSGSLKYTLKEHSNEVDAVAYSLDGKYMASSARDNNVIIWDCTTAKSPKRLLTISGSDNAVKTLAFSPDSTTLATGSYDGAVKIWDTTDGKLIANIHKHSDWVRTIAFSPDGTLIASGAVNSTIKLSGIPKTYTYYYSATPITILFENGEEVIFPKGTIIKYGRIGGIEEVYAFNRGIETLGILKDGNLALIYGSSNPIEIAEITPLYANFNLSVTSTSLSKGAIIKQDNLLITIDKKLAYITHENISGWIKIENNIKVINNVNFQKQLIKNDVPLLKSPKGELITKLPFGSAVNVTFYCPSSGYYYACSDENKDACGWIQGNFIR